ncbi:T9SS type A sorting domain-containing protein [Flavobacterium rhizosphaerae]|uniref:T9SS type A sorting domain-containing protein n=1 Tax=Flavobacterium rhizosphaerae TaxID=3163298 RepID=A0ABW8YYZ1_9FLAO
MKLYYTIISFFLITSGVQAQVYGCTDPMSMNYNPNATVNNGTCTYATTSVTPESSVNLDGAVNETSGLILWNGLVYTHNDDNDINVYGIDPVTGQISSTLPVSGATNVDWEDIAQDDAFIYIADTGNNAHGNRTDLRIIRVNKTQLSNTTPQVEYINFSYEDQTDFSTANNNTTDFDCEAIVAGINNIYIFTKQWTSQQTGIYSIPKIPGNYTAQLMGTLDVGGLVTGATWIEQNNIIALSGYTVTLQPFIYLLYDYKDTDFLSGNKRKINVALPFYQVEGITTDNGIRYYLSNEHFQQGNAINTPQQLHFVDLSEYVGQYLSVMNDTFARAGIRIYPNPAADNLYIEGPVSLIGQSFYITDATGKVILTGMLESQSSQLDIATLQAGLYTVTITGYEGGSYKLAKKP